MKTMKKLFNKKDVLTIPNLLSGIRLIMIPFIIWLYCGRNDYTGAAVLLMISGVTDIADGFIARHFNMVSDFGKITDPIADKATQLSVLICLATRYKYIILLIAVLVIKEIYMGIAGCFAIKKKNTVNSAEWYGKVCTVALYITMIALIIFPNLNAFAVYALISVSIITAIFALAMYVRFYNSIFDKNNPRTDIGSLSSNRYKLDV